MSDWIVISIDSHRYFAYNKEKSGRSMGIQGFYAKSDRNDKLLFIRIPRNGDTSKVTKIQ